MECHSNLHLKKSEMHNEQDGDAASYFIVYSPKLIREKALTPKQAILFGFLDGLRLCYGNGFFLNKKLRENYCALLGITDSTLRSHIAELSQKGLIKTVVKIKMVKGQRYTDTSYYIQHSVMRGEFIRIDFECISQWKCLRGIDINGAAIESQIAYWNKTTGPTYKSFDDLAMEIGCSAKTVYRKMLLLTEQGRVIDVNYQHRIYYMTADYFAMYGLSTLSKKVISSQGQTSTSPETILDNSNSTTPSNNTNKERQAGKPLTESQQQFKKLCKSLVPSALSYFERARIAKVLIMLNATTFTQMVIVQNIITLPLLAAIDDSYTHFLTFTIDDWIAYARGTHQRIKRENQQRLLEYGLNIKNVAVPIN